MYRAQSRRHSFPSPMGHGLTTNHETKAHRTHTTGLLPAQCTHHTSSTTTCRLRQSLLGQDPTERARESISSGSQYTVHTPNHPCNANASTGATHATQCSDVQGRNGAPLRARERAASHAPRLFGANTRAWPPCGFQACNGHPTATPAASSYRTERSATPAAAARACMLWPMQRSSYTPQL